MKAIILHGTDGNEHSNWIPWLKAQLEQRDFQVYTPSLPNSSYPNGAVWTDFILENLPFELDNQTILIGHSAGAAIIPQLLQKLPQDTKLNKVILVSGFHDTLGWDKLKDLQNGPVDYDSVREKAQQFILIHSDNDPYVQLSQAEWLAQQLAGHLRVIKGQGHFNLGNSPKYKEFPKLLSIILKSTALQNLYLTSSFRYPGVADLVLNDIETHLGKQPSEIKLSYITTAGNLHPADQRVWIDEGRTILKTRGWQVFDYDIAGKIATEVEAEFADKDVIFVQGGQCIYMLEQMQKCNFAQIIQQALARGVPYIGESTGSIVTGQDISAYRFLAKDRRANPPVLEDCHGMGLVNFLIRPHWNNPEKRARYMQIIQDHLEAFCSIDQPIICLNDNQLIHVEGDNFQIWQASSK